ncbi:cbb3-type cytochrome c oxidase subunit I [Marinimicrobium agarilyticum]|uniref:cbb3-type cytochrome c oxidase subunit I n=1 Tax=Marinimicrobium agarilyticum TaxID=306546 RepID=UPI0003F8EC78|nr:cbb3-type cytochrome c oxidase subunit I [Marinimicrobium agarilyticum]
MTGEPLNYFWLGKLSLESLPFVEFIKTPNSSTAIAAFAAAAVIGGAIGIVVLLTLFGKWRVFWREWLTTLDAKKIGIMYIVLALVMLIRAVIEAAFMRAQQMLAVNREGPLSAEHFGELFTTHGTIMIFFMAMPFLIGLINVVMPLQIGARDVKFPLLNAISLALTAAGAVLVMISLVIGEFSTGGWSGYPPFTELAFNPGAGVDYWIWAVTLSSIGNTLTGINFAVTIYKLRAPGMTWFRMPLFSWTALCTSILIIFAMMPLTVATLMLALDRYAGFHFFTNALGGNMMNYANLFWLFGHPEVYIVILPAFGVFSEVFSTFSGKRLYGYHSLVFATIAITVLSFGVWLHHFFTMGQSANLNAAFGIATMLIGVPTGVKVYDWLLTMVRGRVRFTTPMLFSIMFAITFVIGGLSGVLLANPPIDFAVHNSLFLVAHFHNMLIPGTLFGMFAAYNVWFPKMFGFRLSEKWGRISFWFWSFGFYLAFMPLYALGLMGAMRRTVQWFEPQYLPWLLVAFSGAVLISLGLISQVIQLWVSIRNRDDLRAPGGDPWDGRSLEWSVSAPPPEYNFAVIPEVHDRDAFTWMKQHGISYTAPNEYQDIPMPKNSVVAPLIGFLATMLGFALTWHIWWLTIVSFLVILGTVIARSFCRDTEKIIPASQVRQEHEQWLARVKGLIPTARADETTSENQGLAEVAS